MSNEDPYVVYLQGAVEWVARERISVTYGIERYYIPETREEDVVKLQSQMREGQIVAEVAFDSSGKAVIRRILVDGKPLGF